MGCHTWFYRPIKEEEFVKMKEYAPIEIYNLCYEDKSLYDSLMKSYNNNIPCVYGHYWWELGYGSGFKNDFNVTIIKGNIFVEVKEFHDVFRVKNYPRKVVKSRHELRKFMGKNYFKLTDNQLKLISNFFKKYKNGVITFG